VSSPCGYRRMPVEALQRLPGVRPDVDSVLDRGDLLVAVELPAPPSGRSTYRKIRDRASYAFALVSVAAVIDVDASGPDPTIRDAALALGGVAHKPWRARAAEAALRGARPTAENFRRAADAELEGSSPVEGNEFKVPMTRGTLMTGLVDLTGTEV